MYITVASAALIAIRDHVAAAGTKEACGLLLGHGEAVTEALPCRNIAADPARRFEIDPAQLVAAHRQARAGGAAVLGHYHSHPGGASEPSPRDAADAAPDGSLWLIVGAREARLWRAAYDGQVEGRFDPVPCAVGAAVPKGAAVKRTPE